MIRIITISLLVLASVLSPVRAEVPTLRFPEEFSWKGIFDAGFRPKHISGLEADIAECRDQEMIIQFKDKVAFPLDRGRLAFHVQSDDSIRIAEHIGRVPITLQEAKKRLTLFHEVLSDRIVSKGSLPLIADEKDGIVNTYTGQSAVGIVDGLRISYRFTSSLQKEKPVLPVLVISHERKKGALRPPIRRVDITAPEGYEDYDMTPISRVAEFHKKSQEVKSKNIQSEQTTRPIPSADQHLNEESQDIEKEQKKSLLVWVLVGIVLIIVVVLKLRG